MAKRFTDTNIWKTQKWFKRLTPIHKLFWKYLTDSCDHAGIWKIDYLVITEDLGIEDFDISAFVKECNLDNDKMNGKPISRERVMIVQNSHIWVTGFVQYQYENKAGLINANSLVVKSSLDILDSFKLLGLAIEKGYIRFSEPLKGPSNPLKPLEGVKEKDKDIVLEDEFNQERTGACYEMLKAFVTVNPSYQHDDGDLPELLQIAYKIARLLGISKHDAIEDQKNTVIQEWKRMLYAIREDPFFSTKDIPYINKHWKNFIMTLSKLNPPGKSKVIA
jgi:hypothetical protein